MNTWSAPDPVSEREREASGEKAKDGTASSSNHTEQAGPTGMEAVQSKPRNGGPAPHAET